MKKFFGVLVVFVFSAAIYAGNSFLIAPGHVDVDLKHPKTESFLITNDGSSLLHLRIQPKYFPQGDKILGPTKALDPTLIGNDNLVPYMIVSPGAMSLEPGQTRVVRVSIRAPENLQAGEYRGNILVSMLNTEPLNGEEKTSETLGKQFNMIVQFNMRTAVTIYGNVGSVAPKLSMSCNRTPQGIRFDAKNASKYRFDGWLKVFSGKSVEPLLQTRLLMLRNTQLTELLPSRSTLSDPVTLKWFPLNSNKAAGKVVC